MILQFISHFDQVVGQGLEAGDILLVCWVFVDYCIEFKLPEYFVVAIIE